MFKVNEYFDGTVKSIAFTQAEGKATIGVMAPGKYSLTLNMAIPRNGLKRLASMQKPFYPVTPFCRGSALH